MYVLKGRVIDGNGGAPIEKGIVEVTGNRITAVCDEREYSIPYDAEIIEVENGTIMPGLIDQHVHMAVGDNDYRKRYAADSGCRFYLNPRGRRFVQLPEGAVGRGADLRAAHLLRRQGDRADRWPLGLYQGLSH